MTYNDPFGSFTDGLVRSAGQVAGEYLARKLIELGTRPRGTFVNIWVDYNVYEKAYVITKKGNKKLKERKGMRIHLKFEVYNLKNIECRAAAYFYFDNGNALKDFNQNYSTTDGKVCVSGDFTPTYDNTIFSDMVLFIPYEELHLSGGKHSLKFSVSLYDHPTKNFFASSNNIYFNYG